jgi:hypothetical protein
MLPLPFVKGLVGCIELEIVHLPVSGIEEGPLAENTLAVKRGERQ